MITQVFVLGSSSSYGVGAEHAGWGDLIKQYLHAKMYASSGEGEAYEVFNFGKSGCTIDFVKQELPWLLQQYYRGHKLIIVVSVGGNNSKAEDAPDKFVSTPEAYRTEMDELMQQFKDSAAAVIAVGNGYVDEAKTNPKPNPLTGGTSYFTNARRVQFRNITQDICRAKGIEFAEVTVSQQEWQAHYLYEDGLHPNQKGHQLIFEAIKPLLDKHL